MVELDSSLGEASTQTKAAARKGRETPMGDQAPPTEGGIIRWLGYSSLTLGGAKAPTHEDRELPEDSHYRRLRGIAAVF
jgi:hypothetical protein